MINKDNEQSDRQIIKNNKSNFNNQKKNNEDSLEQDKNID